MANKKGYSYFRLPFYMKDYSFRFYTFFTKITIIFTIYNYHSDPFGICYLSYDAMTTNMNFTQHQIINQYLPLIIEHFMNSCNTTRKKQNHITQITFRMTQLWHKFDINAYRIRVPVFSDVSWVILATAGNMSQYHTLISIVSARTYTNLLDKYSLLTLINRSKFPKTLDRNVVVIRLVHMKINQLYNYKVLCLCCRFIEPWWESCIRRKSHVCSDYLNNIHDSWWPHTHYYTPRDFLSMGPSLTHWIVCDTTTVPWHIIPLTIVNFWYTHTK